MLRNIILLLLLTGVGASLSAQKDDVPNRVKGFVYEADNSGSEAHYHPMPFATVGWKGTSIGTITDEKGFFRLETTEETDTLQVSFVGFQTAYVVYGGEKLVNIVLAESGLLEEAEIVGEREDVAISLLDPRVAQVIQASELQRDACCNLSESFETSATVDASFTDAVTATRQIKMLGLDGKYALISKENIPNVRGLGVIYGLGYIPGPWVREISLAKGAGAVGSGYESITGEINVTLKDPGNSEKFHLNTYANQGGRLELNVLTNQQVSENWSTNVMLHSEWNNQRMDRNNDGFLDNPLKEDIVFRNLWVFQNDRITGKYDLTALSSQTAAGQTGASRSGELSTDVWSMFENTTRVEGSAKTAYNLKKHVWKGFGSQFSGVYHDQVMRFGNRDYHGKQVNFRGSILYNSILMNTNHKILVGASFVYDDYDETLDSTRYARTERVPGVFGEYTWDKQERFIFVVGGRLDLHNEYGLFWTPRMHLRYSLNEMNSVKLSAGKGYRMANVIMENVGRLASNRQFNILSEDGFGFGLKPEEGWSTGVSYNSKFKLNYRDASFVTDFYFTSFVNQTVIDIDESSNQVLIYNLPGQSWSSSWQAEFAWSPRRRVDIRTAYRWLDVQTDYRGGRRFAPFVSKHRGFLTASYKTKEKKNKSHWRFDATLQWIGSQRLADTSDNPEEFQLGDRSEDFFQLNSQVTRVFKEGFEIYLGVENALDYRQENAILGAENPFGEEFDASMIWAPVFGRMIFGGLRYTIK